MRLLALLFCWVCPRPKILDDIYIFPLGQCLHVSLSYLLFLLLPDLSTVILILSCCAASVHLLSHPFYNAAVNSRIDSFNPWPTALSLYNYSFSFQQCGISSQVFNFSRNQSYSLLYTCRYVLSSIFTLARSIVRRTLLMWTTHNVHAGVIKCPFLQSYISHSNCMITYEIYIRTHVRTHEQLAGKSRRSSEEILEYST